MSQNLLEPPLLRKSRPAVSVLDFTLSQITSHIVHHLTNKEVQEAYLFGSVVTGTAGAWSDIDLIIIHESNLPFVERSRAFADLLDLGVGMDILVYTREEFQILLNDTSGFWKNVRQTMVRIV